MLKSKGFKDTLPLIVGLLLFVLVLSLLFTLASPSASAASNAAQDGMGSLTQSDVSKITISFYGDTKTEKAFTWFTPLSSVNSDLQLTKLPLTAQADEIEPKKQTNQTNQPNHTVQAQQSSPTLSFSGTNAQSVNSPNERVHKVVAVGLEPGTRYRYQVGDAALDLWSEYGEFETASEGAFSFINITDTQAATSKDARLSAETIQKALEKAPEAKFILHSGDVVDNGSKEQQWDELLGFSQNALMNITLMPAAGNHETSPYSFIEHFNLKTPEGIPLERGAYYSFDYGNAHFVTLNTNESSTEYIHLSTRQMDWLQEDVSEAKQSTDWVILNMHKGPYTLAYYATQSDIIGLRKKVSPLLENLGVDLVFQGHDHYVGRTKPLFNGEVQERGTVYINSGSAGVKVYERNKNVKQSYLDLFAFVNPVQPLSGKNQFFTVYHVDGKRLSGEIYEINQKLPEKEPILIDHFELIK